MGKDYYAIVSLTGWFRQNHNLFLVMIGHPDLWLQCRAHEVECARKHEETHACSCAQFWAMSCGILQVMLSRGHQHGLPEFCVRLLSRCIGCQSFCFDEHGCFLADTPSLNHQLPHRRSSRCILIVWGFLLHVLQAPSLPFLRGKQIHFTQIH